MRCVDSEWEMGDLTLYSSEEQFRIIDANDGNREDGLNRRGPAYLAEFAVNAPLVNAICKRANSLGWNSGNSCLICNGK